jgi:hypothetical protein
MTADLPAPPPDDVIIPFRPGRPDDPVAVVIGAHHMPYYLFADGHAEPATTPEWPLSQTS